jgi:hypothetical protein
VLRITLELGQFMSQFDAVKLREATSLSCLASHRSCNHVAASYAASLGDDQLSHWLFEQLDQVEGGEHL